MGCNKRYHMAYTLQLDLPPNGKVFDSTMQVALSKALYSVYKPLVADAAFVVAVAAAAAVEVVAAVAGLFAWIDVKKSQLTVTVEVDQNTQTIKQRVGFASA